MPRLPSVSIVTPSFNQARYLKQCLQSVSSQTGVGVEHLLLDGGSTDYTFEVVEQHGRHLAHYRSRKDEGQTRALMEGFALANGEILGWLNSDDFLTRPDALALVAKAFADNPDAVMVTGDAVLTDPEGQAVMVDMVAGPSARLFRHTMPVPQQSTFFRRSAYQAVGGLNPRFRYCMDFDLFQRLSTLGTIVRIPEILAGFRLHRDSKTATWGEIYRREVDVCQHRGDYRTRTWLAVKAATMEVRLRALWAQAEYVLKGKPLPCMANARLEPCRDRVRREHGLSF